MTSNSKNKLSTIAAFDFDGTITYRDTLIPFLIYSRGLGPFLWATLCHVPLLFRYLLSKASRQEVKEAFLKQLFKGIPLEQVRQWGIDFIKERMDKGIRPAAIKRLRWHQEQGHKCILVSANLDVVVEPWGKEMGFDTVAASNVAADAKGNVTGKLFGANCWGPEKKRRLDKMLGQRNTYLLYAYGDSLGDKEMLAGADYPFYNLF